MAEAPAPSNAKDSAHGAAHEAAPDDGPAAATTRDRVLLALFWLWAATLLLAALAQLFHWDGVLDALDPKRWFSR